LFKISPAKKRQKNENAYKKDWGTKKKDVESENVRKKKPK